MIRLATIFSGIGAVEQALKKMNQEHEIIFACDNGGINIWKGKNEQEVETIKNEIKKIENIEERKKRVDELYKQTEKTNFVKKSYFANYKMTEEKWYSDVVFLDGTPYKGQVDLFVGGSPCQAFSLVGKRGGFEDTRGTLFYEFARLVKEIEPKVFIYENVEGLLNHDNGKTWEVCQNVFDELGYTWKKELLNAKDFGSAQSRPRIFVVGFKENVDFEFPKPVKRKERLENFLDKNINNISYLSIKGTNFVTEEKNLRKQYCQVNGKIAICQKTVQQNNFHGDYIYEPDPVKFKGVKNLFFDRGLINYKIIEVSENPIVQPYMLEKMEERYNELPEKKKKELDIFLSTYGRIRKLTPNECLKLMGFSRFKEVVSSSQIYKQSGNSIDVKVMKNIIQEIKSALERHERKNLIEKKEVKIYKNEIEGVKEELYI